MKNLAEIKRLPTEQVREQLRFTPHPHAEGGRDPLGRIERSLEGLDDTVRERFYAACFDDLYGVD